MRSSDWSSDVCSSDLEALPLRLVGVRQDDPLERHGADVLGADVVALLGGGQQRVQDLDRRLEHLDEFEQPLGGAVQAAGIAVGVGIGLAEILELADVDQIGSGSCRARVVQYV